MNDQQARDYLLRSSGFSEIPDALRGWILGSPNATLDFAEFFEKGGAIDTSQKILLPSYIPNDPPKIMVDRFSWKLAHQAGSEHMQRTMFGTLVHEIGHDRYNTAVTKFPGGSAEQYVHYRADIEARVIFNSYPIFRDLKNHPDFKTSFPFDSVGYLSGFELGQHYKAWHAGKISDDDAVALISAKVPDTPYGLSEPLLDQNGDGILTYRDLYLRDYNKLIRRQPEMAIAPSARSANLGTIEDFIAALNQGDNEALRSAREAYFGSDDGRQLLEDAANYSRSQERVARAYLQSRGLLVGPEGPSFGSLTGRRDPRDWDHPDHALYTVIRRELPLDVSDEAAAHVMLQAKQARILEPRDLGSVEVRNGQAWVAGRYFLQAAHVDLSEEPPPMQDIVRQSAVLDQQLAQEHAQWLARQQEMARSGPSMSL